MTEKVELGFVYVLQEQNQNLNSTTELRVQMLRMQKLKKKN